MARRPTRQVEEALRDAVERTLQATIGSAQLGRERAQEAVDELVRTAASRVREALEGQRPATHDDIRELRKELRAIGRRLEAIERRLEGPRSSSRSSRSQG